jgi:hypothetical protein
MRLRHGVSVRAVLVVAALALTGGLLAGCRSGDGDPAATARKPSGKKAPPPAEPTIDPAVIEANRTMASGVPIGTSTAPLEVRFDLGSVPKPGETFQVDVAVLPAAPAPVLRLEVTGGEGLTIVEPDGFVAFEKVQAGSVTRLKIRASSAAAGTRLVQVRATLELPGGPESRIFAFPVVIGGQPTAPQAPAAKTATR